MTIEDFDVDEISEADSDIDDFSYDDIYRNGTRNDEWNPTRVFPGKNEHYGNIEDLDEEEDIISILPEKDERSLDSNILDAFETKPTRIPKKKKKKPKGGAKTKGKKKKKKKGKRIADDENGNEHLLEQAVKRVSNPDVENPAELFLISGDSGVGKSHWIESERNRILLKILEDANDKSDEEEDEGSHDGSYDFFPVFCKGTCEIPPQLRIDDNDETDNSSTESFSNGGCRMSRHPMHAITEALNDLICSLTKINYGNEKRIDSALSTNIGNIYGGKDVWKQRIQDALGASEATHLAATGLVPELGNLLDLSGTRAFIEKQRVSNTWDWNSPYKFHRSCVAIRDLLRAISEAHHPIVMVLHNLHFADKDTFRVLHFLLTGNHLNPSWAAEGEKRKGHKSKEWDHLYGNEAITSTARLNNFLVIGLHELDSGRQNDGLHLLERSFCQRKKSTFDEESAMCEQGYEIKSREPVSIQSHLTKIHMEPFHRKKVEDLLRSSISEPKKSKIKDENDRSLFDAKLQELAELIFEWTGGNAFYTLQVIELLKEDGAITSSSSNKLDIAKAQTLARRWNNSTIGLTAARIDLLPKAVRFVIINVSILRQTYIEFSLQELFHLLTAVFAEKGKKKKNEMEFPLKSVSELEDALSLACDIGFMKCVRCQRNSNDANCRWAFTHTIVRDEAYSLFTKMKKQKKMEIHFKLGTRASAFAIVPTSGEQENDNLPKMNKDSFKFLAADQLAMAEGILYQDCTKVAILFVETAELCISRSAFCAAIRYLKVIIDILERHSLLFASNNHGLCVKIHLLLARLHSVCDHGTNDKSEALRRILEEGKNLKDQIMLHQAEIGISVGQKRNKNALKQVLSALATLGEKFPPEADLPPIISREIEKLRQVTEQKDNHSLLHPSHCTDKKTYDLMILLSNLIEISRSCKNERLSEVAMIRMMNISLIKGFTPQYSMSFAHYGAILMQRGLTMNSSNMAKEGYRMGQISERMARIKGFSGGHSLTVFQYYNSHWRRFYRRSLGEVLSIYNAQLESGDYCHIEFTTFTYVQYHLASGHNLTKLDDNLQLFDALYQDYKMDNHWIIELAQRFVQNMLGETLDPFLFYGNSIEEQSTRIQRLQDSGEDDAVQLMHFLTLFVSILFHNHELSKSCLENIVEENVIPIWKPWISFFRCYLDIVSLQAIDKKSERKKLKEAINMQRDKLLDWYDQGAQNCSVMISLIDAELMISDYTGNYDSLPTIRIKKFFDDAIEVAEDQELGHMEAFCFERASMHFAAAGSDESAAEYIAKAHECYLEWNAIAKVDVLEENHAGKLQHAKEGSIRMIGENYVKKNSDLQYNPERSIGGGRNIKKLDIKGAAKTAEKRVKEMAFGTSSGKSPKGAPKPVVQSPRTPSRRPKLAISVRLGKTSS